MNKRELFKKVIDDNTMSKSDNKIVIMDKIQKQKNPFSIKRFSKYAVAAVIVLAVFCSPIIISVLNNMGIFGDTENNSGNWFSLVAYAAENSPFEILKDMEILMPSGTWNIRPMSIGWQAANDENGEAIPGGFGIQGENIKSVNLQSENGTFRDTQSIRYNPYEEETWFKNPVYLEGDDILLTKYFSWYPEQLILTDTIAITVTFNNGEIITQYVKITIDEQTGEMFAQIIE